MGDIENSLKKCAESYKELVDSEVRFRNRTGQEIY